MEKLEEKVSDFETILDYLDSAIFLMKKNKKDFTDEIGTAEDLYAEIEYISDQIENEYSNKLNEIQKRSSDEIMQMYYEVCRERI